MSVCRSCSARIRWANTTTGSTMPVDADPDPNGNVTLLVDENTRRTMAHVATGDELARARAAGEAHMSHFVTCPDAGKHRRRHG